MLLATVARFSLVVAVLILVAPLATDAQQAAKVYRIGYLSSGPSTSNLFVEPFRHGLRAHGWTEGQNVIIDYRFAEGRRTVRHADYWERRDRRSSWSGLR